MAINPQVRGRSERPVKKFVDAVRGSFMVPSNCRAEQTWPPIILEAQPPVAGQQEAVWPRKRWLDLSP
jgi:hypothetical protein